MKLYQVMNAYDTAGAGVNGELSWGIEHTEDSKVIWEPRHDAHTALCLLVHLLELTLVAALM